MAKKHGKKICFVRHGYYPDDRRVLKEVAALHDEGYLIDVICLNKGHEKPTEVVNGVTVYRLSHHHKRGTLLRYAMVYGLSIVKISLMLTFLFLKKRYDCIQVNTLPDFLIFTTTIPKLLGTKIVLDMHEPTPEMYQTLYEENGSPLILKLIIFLEQLSIQFANSVFAVNDTILERYVDRGADRRKIQVVRNVPPEEFKSFESQTGNICKKGFTLITHGTVLKRYGQEVMVRAVPLLRDKIKDLNVLIIGPGEDAQRIKSLCEALNCTDIVTITGKIPYYRIGDYLKTADIGIVPLMDSPFSELCQPNKLFEYIVYDKPIICSRLAAIEESFDDSAILFFHPGSHEDLARCVLDLYHNPQKREELARQASKSFEHMMWSKTKKHYIEAINALAA